MNIFYLSHDPVEAAAYFYDKHKVKMILESAQMLCTAHHVIDGDLADVPYRMAHKNHPSTIWVRSSAAHYKWLYLHMLALGQQYTKRYGKYHLTIDKCRDALANPPKGLADNGFEQPPQCMPDEYKVDGDSVSAYWNYYENEKHTVRNAGEPLITRP